MSSHLYYENLPGINKIEQFRKNIYYKLLDFTIYLNTAKYARKKNSLRIKYRVMTSQEVKQMFHDLNYKYYEIYGYEMNFTEDQKSPPPNSISNLSEEEEGVFIKIYDETNRADEHFFENFLKSQSIVDHKTDYYIKEEQIKVINKFSLFNVMQLEREPNLDSKYIYISPNIYILNTQLYSIYNLQAKPRIKHRPLLRLIEQKEDSAWPNVPDNIIIEKWHFLNNNTFPGISVQRNFVKKALNTPDFAILEGPPGSGKTITICELVLQAIENNQRVLLCISTHVAVDNVLEKLMEKDEIIAIRIGKKNNPRIKSSVKKYLLNERIKTERERLIEKLTKLGKKRNSGQNYYYRILKSDDGVSEIQSMILDNANLICGTIIGILKHPDIAEEKNSPRTIFDMLIIDEASKTTFQEFIVPALFCRKWVLVGDPKQLSPFIDDMEVRKSIDGFLPEIDKIVCRDCFCCWKFKNFNLIISEEDEKVRDLYRLQLEALNLAYLDLEKDKNFPKWAILANQIIIGTPEQIEKISDLLPYDAYLRGTGFSQKLKASNNYWKKKEKNSYIVEKTKGNFSKLLSWRLIKEFGLRYTKNDQMKIKIRKDIKNLKPIWYKSDIELNEFNKNLSNLKKVAFPSILELLKEGFYEDRNEKRYRQSVIKNGFDDSDLKPRYEKLRFNHRMHSQISKFPRINVYNNDALQDDPNVDNLRKWKYNQYSQRSLWINVLEKNINQTNVNHAEAKILLEELENFLNWSQRNHNPNHPQGNWEIAVLSFYRNQEDLLIDLITKKFNKPRKKNNFELKKFNVRITICTVDRFQGHEADLVLLSFVKTTSIGFLNSINRLNVGITRAKFQLILIGNKNFFLNQRISPILQKLAQITDNISLGTNKIKNQRIKNKKKIK